MNYSDSKFVIFDFDGTIADTLEIIAEIYNDLAPKYNCKILHYDEKEKFRKMKPLELFKECGISQFLIPIFTVHIRTELFKRINQIKPIAGIDFVLKTLKNNGIRLGLMSSNTRKNINTFLKNNSFESYFDFVHTGKNIFGKDLVVSHLIRKYSLNKSNLIYVGDEVRDIEAMKKIKVPVFAVSWGFNSHEILTEFNPDFFANDTVSLAKGILDFFKV
ncbi:MAG TPA: HAD hydrolase-like protein [Bacteroidales bacterium]|jgi:phosphoglycolate phosphatase-like HAD superfamily hydrolase|nr:HAD hydrolase-like protein [Bacteroidales bacterium]HOL98539.1 HAD hydrolase-like protein [Bacteroidales bacterium]HOM35698.1 HAD hydrolase-like protein [Bacteroidales bacterium]HPD23162.1 HAD hydrolase-like protein [Bacteroidales bacterium]HRS99091.1 HAD hydrolase-like protein [Bacteroidales bacterium]